ncbi:MAG: RnfABCDGE type electron transport complex subunit D [Planctomycetes bacterium B3_Pla]|nr:MAG: RnfABCDGE type electron transport complex subunit D [Planctomycetes bacterium B3_Pla]
MKWLLKIIDATRPTFEEGGKLQILNPVFGALEHFFFAPSATTIGAPHIRDPLDLKRVMSMVIISVVPCVLAAFYFFGLRFLAMIIVSYAAGLTVEAIFAMVRKEGINEGFFVTGILWPLILPPTLPLWMVGLGVAFGVFIGKELFGGTGRNVFNPALVGRCFLALAYPKQMAASFLEPSHDVAGRLLTWVDGSTADAVTSATPLGILAVKNEMVATSHMFLGSVSGSSGETSALLIILGGGFLLLTRVANWRTVLATLASFFVLTVALIAGGKLTYSVPGVFGPAVWHLCAGGLLFGAFFMATDPVTSPTTNAAKWMYGIVIGSATVLIRNFVAYPEGVTFAILLGNIMAPILDEIVISIRIRRLRSEG